MNTIKSFLLFMLTLNSYWLGAQSKSPDGHYLVEFDEFSPPIQDIIRSFEGFPATPFLANDLNGVERFINDFRGRPCLLLFWNSSSEVANTVFDQMNLAKQTYGNQIEVVVMADESREELKASLKGKDLNLIVIPNTRMLSEAVYGIEMGNPRLFVIDESGKITHVIPASHFEKQIDYQRFIEAVIDQELK